MTASKDEGRKPTDRPGEKASGAGPAAAKPSATPSAAPAKPGPTGSSAVSPSATPAAESTAPKPSEPLKPASGTGASASSLPSKLGATGSSAVPPSGAPATGSTAPKPGEPGKPAASGAGLGSTPSANKSDPGKAITSDTANKPGAGPTSSGTVPPIKSAATGSSAVPPGAAPASSASPKPGEPAKSGATGSAAIKPDAPKSDAKPDTAAGSTKPGGTAQTAPRVGAGDGVTDGPIIDLKAKRLPDPAATKSSETGSAKAETGASDTAPSVGGGGPGYGLVAASGLIGGVVGAGLLYVLTQGGATAPDPGRLDALDRKIATLAPRDALTALDQRIGANEQAIKPLSEGVKSASTRADEALQKASAAPAASGEATAPAGAPPADLVARLDALDQRVSALQEEPGRDQPPDSTVAATRSGDDTMRLSELDQRLKTLETKGGETSGGAASTIAPSPSAETEQKLAALQGELEARAKADTTLGERLDQLQQSVDSRVSAATEAVRAATDANRQAAEAGKAQAEEAAKTIDRRLQEQSERLAALDKAVDGSAKAATVQAALRIVAADRIATALDAGAPYSDALGSLRGTTSGDGSALASLEPFAESGAPTATALASEFRPIREKILAAQRAARTKSVAETGSVTDRLQSMASSLVQVKRNGEPAGSAPATAAEDDPTAKVMEALEQGRVGQASEAFAALPEDIRSQAGAFGDKLKARAQADAAALALQADAFKNLSAPADER